MTETTQELLARLTGFTPGPWKIDAGKGDWLGGFYADTYEVCTFGSDTTYYPTAGEAPNFWNSALIEAAPDLHRIATEQAAEIERLRESLIGIKRAATARMSARENCKHSYYFHTASAALE